MNSAPPCASIRAAVETIKESGIEDQETTRRCVEIINNHVLRMQLMVQDLLDLSARRGFPLPACAATGWTCN